MLITLASIGSVLLIIFSLLMALTSIERNNKQEFNFYFCLYLISWILIIICHYLNN